MIELVDEKGNVTALDARPSDAIALALRMDSAIFVEQKVLDISATTRQTDTDFEDETIPAAEDWPDLIG